jgi:hypothetical protein
MVLFVLDSCNSCQLFAFPPFKFVSAFGFLSSPPCPPSSPVKICFFRKSVSLRIFSALRTPHSAFTRPIFLSPIFLSKSLPAFSVLLNHIRAIRVNFFPSISRVLDVFRISVSNPPCPPSSPVKNLFSLGIRVYPCLSVVRISGFGFRDFGFPSDFDLRISDFFLP